MRKKIVAGNWKMNTSISEAEGLLNQITSELEASTSTKVIVFPPATHLYLCNKLLHESIVKWGAQNMYYEDKGAFTGEIAPQMLLDQNCTYVLVGHSERRQYFKEGNELLNKKVKKALEVGLTPVYCCGEHLSDRESDNHFNINKEQIEQGLFNLSPEEFSKVIIAYEPVWAIGTGVTASPEQAQEMHEYIRNLVAKKYGNQVAENLSILYGGSVKPANAAELFAKNDIDGGLIGGASLKSADFVAIINAMP